jgi:hypothetical protein
VLSSFPFLRLGCRVTSAFPFGIYILQLVLVSLLFVSEVFFGFFIFLIVITQMSRFSFFVTFPLFLFSTHQVLVLDLSINHHF